MRNRGQISIGLPILLTIGGMVVASVVGVFNMTGKVREEVTAVERNVAGISERAAKLETSITDTDRRLKGIEDSMKRIEDNLINRR
jgi:septal ring factor EnvC (AmiA/AmiB activator)